MDSDPRKIIIAEDDRPSRDEKRFDGRGFDETRPVTAKVGIIPRADGSAMLSGPAMSLKVGLRVL